MPTYALALVLLLAAAAAPAGAAQPSPEPPVDQEHLYLSLHLGGNDEAPLHATAQFRLRTLTDGANALPFLAAGLAVDSVLAGVADSLLRPVAFDAGAGDTLVVRLDSLAADTTGLLPAGAVLDVRIVYTARPRRGLAFALDPPAAWSASPDGLAHWLPILDLPGDLLTAEIDVTADSTWRVLASGRLRGATPHPDGRATYRYAEDRPITLAGLFVAAGPFEPVTAPDGAAPIVQGWAMPGRTDAAGRTFEQAADILGYFGEWLGYPYPRAAHPLVVVPDAEAGCLAAAGATLCAEDAVGGAGDVPVHDPAAVYAAALARQWLGHLVFAADAEAETLLDGLAAYLAARYVEHASGREAADVYLLALAGAADTAAARPSPIHAWDERPALPNGPAARVAWRLHRLRHEAGDDALRAVLRAFVRRYAFDAVGAGEVEDAVVAPLAGSAGASFEQEVGADAIPSFDVEYDYDARAESLAVTLRPAGDAARLDGLALEAEVQTLDGPVRFPFVVEAAGQTYRFPLRLEPRFVVIDPDHTLLARFGVRQPATAWVAQLRYGSGVPVRLAAVRALRGLGGDPALLVGLRTAFEAEPSGAVRAAIVEAIGALPASAAAERALQAAVADADAAVRVAALEALMAYPGTGTTWDLARTAAQRDPSNDVQAAAVVVLARTGAPDALAIVQSALVTPSRAEVIRRAAFEALDALALPPADGAPLGLTYSAPGHPPGVRAAALRFLGRYAETRRVLDRLIEGLADPSRAVRAGAIDALGRAGTAPARAALQAHLAAEADPGLRAAVARHLAAAPSP